MLTSSTIWLVLGAIALVLALLSLGPTYLFTQALICAGVAAILHAIENHDV